VSNALRLLPEVELSPLPRMADFAVFGEAVSRAMGNTAGMFADVYRDTRQVANKAAVEGSPVAVAVVALMKDRELPWTGTATELLKELTDLVGDKVSISKAWPKDPTRMGGALKRAAPLLRATENIDVDGARDKKSRSILIAKIPAEQPQS
jgi:hypothetical protein